ncbi:pyruvate, phosphate dikinase [Gordonia sp. GONU]|uniref:Pyruvate, phosphate dikinase n=2 Tax=Gordoniaceae TaxID=85026 RepID=A0AAE4R7H0_9ACTN|nr:MULTISPECIES: pyruvate, phosphate dikinase [Gordonia]MCR8900029.1 pyruvate, phosphate dikinase [Gordonia sp. GONU]MCZ4581358.1 pyruvate, phosphate dikinase [Gordonia amicalis]MDJ0455266.1 pyruvate, phosphate dikinase [Gordonia amicalis]MDV6314454.1 pyruvate, phosphate dikinase [Gordonia amicalis]MDV7078715.1 pyruvate, phosphate dikinase [Gordonia amicalis]
MIRLDGSVPLDRMLVGNKGYGLDAMRRHGLPVPPAFAITTAACRAWQRDRHTVMEGVWPHIREALTWLESETGRTFAHGPHPLLVSVRSGAAQSMPGMMDTILDLGLDDDVRDSLAAECGESFATDTRQRFVEMYTKIVLDGAGEVPADPWEQLRGAIEAVFESWNTDRARAYRAHHDLDDDAGTAVVVQAMVFGNLNDRSGSGVLFSRNPMTGALEPFGEWLACSQGEDVVAGTHSCDPIDALGEVLPDVHRQLLDSARTLEGLGTDVQDIEFTVEDGQLWILQTRNAKRSAAAAVRFALALRDEGAIDDREVVRRVEPSHIATLLKPALQPETRFAAPLLATGLPACPGVASGVVITDPDEVIEAADDQDVVLARATTSPDDIHGMLAAAAIVTELGGATSHAAVVSREIGRPAVVGCGAGTITSFAGQVVTVDGNNGEIRAGALELTAWKISDSPELIELEAIIDAVDPSAATASLLDKLTAARAALDSTTWGDDE